MDNSNFVIPPNPTLQFDESSYYHTGDTSFEPSWMTMLPPLPLPPTNIPQNQPMTTDHPAGQRPKTKSEIVYENYVKEYAAPNDANPYLLDSYDVDSLLNYDYSAPMAAVFSEFDQYFNFNEDTEIILHNLIVDPPPSSLKYTPDHFLTFDNVDTGSPIHWSATESNIQLSPLSRPPPLPDEAVAVESNLQFLPLPPPPPLPNEAVAEETSLQFFPPPPPPPNKAVAAESNWQFLPLPPPPPANEAVAVDQSIWQLLPLLPPPMSNEAVVVESNLQLPQLLPPPPTKKAVAAVNGKACSLKIKKREWCVYEHCLFLIGMVIFKKGEWKMIAKEVIITKSYKQVASHAQKFFKRQALPKEKRKRPSIHDIDTFDPALLMHVCNRLRRPPPSLPYSFQ